MKENVMNLYKKVRSKLKNLLHKLVIWTLIAVQISIAFGPLAGAFNTATAQTVNPFEDWRNTTDSAIKLRTEYLIDNSKIDSTSITKVNDLLNKYPDEKLNQPLNLIIIYVNINLISSLELTKLLIMIDDGRFILEPGTIKSIWSLLNLYEESAFITARNRIEEFWNTTPTSTTTVTTQPNTSSSTQPTTESQITIVENTNIETTTETIVEEPTIDLQKIIDTFLSNISASSFNKIS